jgi:hypothetical protein
VLGGLVLGGLVLGGLVQLLVLVPGPAWRALTAASCSARCGLCPARPGGR